MQSTRVTRSRKNRPADVNVAINEAEISNQAVKEG